MTNTKWLRRALLGGVALGVMATGAHADELAKLKGELEALQSRVNQLEQQPTMAALPEGASYVTLNRGSANIKTHLDRATLNLNHNDMVDERGFTIAITPSADLPAPVAEVVVYGFVKGDFIYSIDNDVGTTFSMTTLFSAASDDLPNDHLRAHAKQTRFGIRSRTDTAIGQIRTQVEGDFFSGSAPSSLFRARHLFGEWDITPNWTFLAGQTTRTAVLTPIGVPTVDFGYSAGVGQFPRAMQVRMTYHAGPISWAVAAERPTRQTDASWPNLSAYFQFDAPGGHQFIVTGGVADRSRQTLTIFRDTRTRLEIDPLDPDLVVEVPHPDAVATATRRTRGGVGWVVGAGANISLMDIATLTAGAHYGENGEQCQYLVHTPGCGVLADAFHRPLFPDSTFFDFFGDRGWGGNIGVSFNVTDTTSINVQYGFTSTDNLLRRGDFGFDPDYRPARHVDVHTLHANIMWQPVRQMRLGWEVMWGEVRTRGGDAFIVVPGGEDEDDLIFDRGRRSKDALRAQFGAWFFF